MTSKQQMVKLFYLTVNNFTWQPEHEGMLIELEGVNVGSPQITNCNRQYCCYLLVVKNCERQYC